jgi:uncharacterized protein DUF4953/uncharacterized protein DUF5117/uncharacterized protein DUF5118
MAKPRYVRSEMNILRFAVCLLAMLAISTGGSAGAQAPPKGEEAASQKGTNAQKEAYSGPKPYEKVITPDAKSKIGIFTVHQIKEKVYYEIPAGELGKDFLWTSRVARTPFGTGYGGQEAAEPRVVRWERNENRVLLRDVSYEIVADRQLPVARGVEAASNATILMAFNVEAFGKDDAPVIEVTKLFTTEVPEFSVKDRLQARAFDPERSFLERVTPYPINIEVEATHTFTRPSEPPNPSAPPPPPPPKPSQLLFGGPMKPGSATVLMHYSMVKLPENQIQPRLYDSRVGYFTVELHDYSRAEHRAPERKYIARWRLEKKDPSASLSEPVKPIVYYIDSATPEKWRPWIKRGVEDWQVAFEEAGFKNAIIAKDPPTPQEDPNWSPEDVRYSMIYWLPSEVENGMGPHISDPRTGETLNADIQLWQNILKTLTDWYFVQAGPLDKRAQKLPLPDDLMGHLLEFVVEHEVGHTLGLHHNMKSSSLYPAEKVRDPAWLKTMGHVASIMDYSRFNYVAQPEDNIPPEYLVPKVGPYDCFAIRWGYKLIPGANSPDAEKTTLNAWAHEQDKTPWLRWSNPYTPEASSDPGENIEAVGDADAVYSTGLGMKNLRRVMGLMLAATSHPGEPYDDLKEMYRRLLEQWGFEISHVVAIVGGVETQEKHAEQEGVLFAPVSRERQIAAVRFLNENAFQTPTYLLRPEILQRIEPAGALKWIQLLQMAELEILLDDTRFSRLIEQEATEGAKAYRPVEFLTEVRKGIWRELDAPSVKIDAYRRNLQRGYLELLAEKVSARKPVEEAGRAFFRLELENLRTEITHALPKAADPITRAHLEDVRDQIAKALDPKFLPPESKRPSLWELLYGNSETTPGPLNCWPEGSVLLDDRDVLQHPR